jgi:hypothetical protein
MDSEEEAPCAATVQRDSRTENEQDRDGVQTDESGREARVDTGHEEQEEFFDDYVLPGNDGDNDDVTARSGPTVSERWPRLTSRNT